MWFNKYGLVTNTESGLSGNDILYTAHYVAGLALTGTLTRHERDKLLKALSGYSVAPGLYRRTPTGDGGQQAHDDYIGLVSICSFFFEDTRFLSRQVNNWGRFNRVAELQTVDVSRPKLNKFLYNALQVLSFGRGVRRVWNNVYPGQFHYRAWFAKRPEALATIKMSGGEWPGLFGLLYFHLFMLRLLFVNKKEQNDNSFTIRWHMALAVRNSKIVGVNLVSNLIREHVRKVWGDAGQLVHWHFGHNGHPLKDLLKSVT